MYHLVDDVENSYHVSLGFYVVLLLERERERDRNKERSKEDEEEAVPGSISKMYMQLSRQVGRQTKSKRKNE
jgi:hypothetical protein